MEEGKYPVVFFDRDGVINEWIPNGYVTSWDLWQFRKDALRALKKLKEHHIPVIVITNQSAVGRGLMTITELEAIHTKFLEQVIHYGGAILDIFYCPHAPEDFCDCRKPKPKLIFDALEKYSWIDLENSWFIGDKDSDTLTAKNAGCQGYMLAENQLLNDALDVILDQMKIVRT
jgi:D-glycero-D-manno-heptose 1,7-bisphosphate phosphatase